MGNLKKIFGEFGDTLASSLGQALMKPQSQHTRNILPLLLSMSAGKQPEPNQMYSSWAPDQLNPYGEQILTAARKYGVDPSHIEALMWAESQFNPKAQSPVGASGLMQFMPATFRGLGGKDVWDPNENIDLGTQYLKQQLDEFGSLDQALAAYNAGPGAVRKHGGVPPYRETQNYVDKIYKRLGMPGTNPMPQERVAPLPPRPQDWMSRLKDRTRQF